MWKKSTSLLLEMSDRASFSSRITGAGSSETPTTFRATLLSTAVGWGFERLALWLSCLRGQLSHYTQVRGKTSST